MTTGGIIFPFPPQGSSPCGERSHGAAGGSMTTARPAEGTGKKVRMAFLPVPFYTIKWNVGIDFAPGLNYTFCIDKIGTEGDALEHDFIIQGDL